MNVWTFTPKRSSLLYWGSNAVLALLALFVVREAWETPRPPGKLWFEGLSYLFFLLFAPGTLSLLASGFVIAFRIEPPTLLRIWSYAAAAFYIFAIYAIYTASSL
ncbi:hypothetical protein RA25_04330 [Leisingera sp. ANG-S5]|nr:hypothetical protein RA25_04330 [Leisingera sp. ANG-S5]